LVSLKDKKGVLKKLLFSFHITVVAEADLSGALLLFPYIISYLDILLAGCLSCRVFCVPDG
jgi:hypothetical protein